MHRLGRLVGSEWVAHSHPPVFERGRRLVAGIPGSDPAVFQRMVECLEPPYDLLYVLHTPRGEAQPGRYQSPPLSLVEVTEFLARFAPLLSGDGRYDLWAHSPADDATVVWDRHDQMYCYGPLDRYEAALVALGFAPGQPAVPAPHEHHYRAELDALAAGVLTAFEWSRTPLRPEDEQ